MKKIILAGFTCIALLTACNDEKKTDSTTVAKDANEQKFDSSATDMTADNEFAVAAANGGMTEVKLSELAKTNATSAAVKGLADMMIADHTKAGDELKGIAAKNSITLPATLSAESQKNYDELATKKGAEFDKAYVNMMEKDHDATIDKFNKEAENGKNADLKAFATKTLPALNHHKQMVADTKAGMK